MGAGAQRGSLVVRIEEIAAVDREAATTDARVEAAAKRFERGDARVDVRSPAA